MIRRCYSQCVFQKYRPYQSKWRRFLNWFKKRNKRKKQLIYSEPTRFQKNPFKKSAKIRKKIGLLAKCIILLCLVTTWLGLLLYLPFFNISKINYVGVENINEAELAIYLKENFLKPNSKLPFKNYFLINQDKIAKKLLENFPLLTIEVKKIFPNQLSIKLQEKKSSIIYDNGTAYFLMDENGSIIKYLTKVSEGEFVIVELTTSTPTGTVGTLIATTTVSTNTTTTSTIKKHTPNYKKINGDFGKYPIVYDRRELPTKTVDKNLLPNNFITGILIMNEAMVKQGIGVKYYIMENVGSGAQLVTTNVWDILFQPTNNLDQQLNNLKIILKNNRPQQYVDIRFGDRVYWK